MEDMFTYLPMQYHNDFHKVVISLLSLFVYMELMSLCILYEEIAPCRPSQKVFEGYLLS